MKEYFLVPGDILEMPDTEEDIRLCKKNDEDFYLLVLKNGIPFWLDISAFVLCNSDEFPAHEVSWELFVEGCENYKDTVLYLCGKTIECGEWKQITVPYDDLGNTVTVKIVQMKFKQ